MTDRSTAEPAQLAAYAGVRTVVLGASGFIGRWVGRMLTELGSDLHLVVRDTAKARTALTNYRIDGAAHEQDLSEFRGVTNLVAQLRPAVVFNLAGYGVDPAERDESTARRINVDLIAEIAEAVAASADRGWAGQNLVHVGSALEYGTASGDLAEDGPATPTTLYGQTKLAGTMALQQVAASVRFRALTARLFTVYGAGEHEGRLLPSLLRCARTGELLNLTAGQQMRDFTYVGDVAEGLLRLGLSSESSARVVNLATGRLTKVRDFVDVAAGILGIPSQNLLHGAIPTRPEEMRHAEVTNARLRTLVRWTPGTSIADGIRRTWAFTNDGRHDATTSAGAAAAVR
jgi:UDP-glucose 4-epimerase